MTATLFPPFQFNSMDTPHHESFASPEVVMKIAGLEQNAIEGKYRHLIENLPSAAYTCDSLGRILIYNKAAEDLWGRRPIDGEVLCGAWKVYSADGVMVPLEDNPVARAITQEKVIKGEEFIIERHNGSRRYVVMHAIPDFDSSGKVTGVTNILTDITSLKESESRTLTLIDHLHSKNKELDQFTYLVSHILRSPVARILGLGSILRLDPQNAQFIVQRITEETFSLDSVLKDLNLILSIRNLENEKWEYVDFREQILLVSQTLSKEIKQNSASITTHFSGVSGIVSVKNYVYSILNHLISNSIKFKNSSQPLEMHVLTEEEDGYVCLSVKDNGIGIDLETHDRNVFELYRQFHDQEISGRGTGLYLVKTYVESVGGMVKIESKAGEGTKVKVYFPKDQLYAS